MRKYFLNFASIAFSVVCIATIVIYYILSNIGKDAVQESLQVTSTTVNKMLTNFFDNERKDISYIAYLLAQENAEEVDIIKQYITLHPDVYQIRVLDASGYEQLKFVQTEQAPVLITNADLQNKSNRQYFKDLSKTPFNEVYFSSVELNKEFGRIEIPYKPVLRFGIKYLNYQNEPHFLIINLDFNSLVDELRSNIEMNHFCSIYIADSSGQFLYHPDEAYTWSNTIANRDQAFLSKLFPELNTCLKKDEEGVCKSDKGFFYYNTAYNALKAESALFKLIVHCDNNTISNSYLPRVKKWIYILSICFLINLIPIWFWAKNRALQDKISKEIEVRNVELKKANQTKDKFFRIISHDLRSPLNSIQALSALVADEVDDNFNPEVKEYIALIEESAFNAKKMINDLFEWAQTQTQSIALNKSVFHLKDLIEQVKAEIGIVAKHKNIQLAWDYKPLIEVLGDQHMLNTVVRNLISNAIKFSHNNSTIYISAHEQNENFVLSVRDEGVGMKPEIASGLFDIGKTFSTPGTNNEQGSGLGLVLCKEFMRLHDGDIKVESKLNVGSTFTISLPKA